MVWHGEPPGAQTVTFTNATFAVKRTLGTGPESTISGATLAAEVAGVLPPGVDGTVVVGVVGVVGVLLLLPPQPTANHKAEIKITKPIFRTFSPLPYIRRVDALRDHSRNVSVPNIGARVSP
jgi:hypothetical protein